MLFVGSGRCVLGAGGCMQVRGAFAGYVHCMSVRFLRACERGPPQCRFGCFVQVWALLEEVPIITCAKLLHVWARLACRYARILQVWSLEGCSAPAWLVTGAPPGAGLVPRSKKGPSWRRAHYHMREALGRFGTFWLAGPAHFAGLVVLPL